MTEHFPGIAMARYAKDFHLEIPYQVLRRLAQESEGLSQDYLREIMVEMRQSSDVDETSHTIRRMRKLLGISDELKDEAKPDEPVKHINGVNKVDATFIEVPPTPK